MESKLFKGTSYEVKDLDTASGVVVAYANVYNFKDSDGDISGYGSFTKTVSENKKRIKVLKDHDKRITLGVPLDLDAKDTYGLLTKTQFNMNKEVSRDMFTDIQLLKEHDLNAELSIGYSVMKRDTKDKSIITEYMLMEYSFLSSWGANQLSTVQGVKNIKSISGIIELIEKSYNLPYSDTRLKQIENILKTIDTQEEEPSKKDTLNLEPLANIINNFKF